MNGPSSASPQKRGDNPNFLEADETGIEYCTRSSPFENAALDAARPSWPQIDGGGEEIVCIAVTLPFDEKGAAIIMVGRLILWEANARCERGKG